MCAFGVELTLPVHRRARQDPYAGGTTGRSAAGAHPGDPMGVPRVDITCNTVLARERGLMGQ